jgi:hypothetical protein
MTRFCTIALSLLLCCQSVHSETGPDSVPGAPLAGSVTREASRLAVEARANIAPTDWETLRELTQGKRIVVTTRATTLAGEFISADAATLILQRGDYVEHLSADDVLFVTARVRRGSAAAAVFGTLGGIWLGSGLAYGVAESTRCYSGCAGVNLGIWSAIVGVPIAGGYGAWRLSSRPIEEVVYRRR